MLNLHTHTEYSYKDAISKVEEVALRQKQMGYNHFCITDHGTMAAFPDAFQVAKKLGMYFIPGIEVYLAPPLEFDLKNKINSISEANKILRQKKSTEEQKLEARKIINKWETIDARKNFHLTLIAYTQEGLENLFRIYSSGSTYYKYRVNIDSIINNKEGILVLSGCMGGELAFYVKSKQITLAEELIKKYKTIFGSNYYIEIQNHNIKSYPEDEKKGYLTELETYKIIISLAEKFNVPMIATNDSHYIKENDEKLHNIYKEICYHKTEDQATGELGFHGTGYHMTTEKELKERFINAGYSNVDSMFDNINKIIPKIDPNIEIKKSEFFKDKNKELRELVLKGWEKLRKGTIYEEQSRKQLEWELSVIKEKNFSNYFVNFVRIINRAKELNILTGPGRGSAAGSEVVFLLGITKVDPLKYGLMFERFMNPSRSAMPDIDIDLESRLKDYNGQLGSDIVMKSLSDVFKFYGRIANVVTASSIVLFKKLATYFGVPFTQSNKFTTTDFTKEIFNLKSKPDEEDFAQKVGQLGFNYSENWKNVYKYLDICFELDGIAFGSSIHASGKIMSEEETNLPINDEEVINFNGKNLENYGYIKFDLLSLDTLNPIHDLFGLDIDWDFTDDKEAWEVLNNGDTDYVFQLGGAIPKKMLKEVNINSIEQLAEISAINRPGPLAMGMHEKWVDIHKGIVNFTKEEAVLRDLLKNAFGENHSGLVIYQEDVMKIFQDGAGFNLAEADNIRRAMGKKDRVLMESFKPRFLKDWKLEGDPEIIWDAMEGFARYAFNKSHAVAYALVSFYTARIWAHYKENFLEWLINNTSGPKKKAALETCKQLGWKLMFPDYRNIKNNNKYRIKDKLITAPINFNGSFNSLSEFMFGENTKIEKGNLILMGVLDTVTPDRFGLLELLQAIPNNKNYIPTFPESNLLELIQNGELLNLWEIKENNEQFIDLIVQRARTTKEIRLYKNKLSLPGERLQFNIKQDLKNFGLIKEGQLSRYPVFNTDRLLIKYNKFKEHLIQNFESKIIKFKLKDEIKNLLFHPFYKNIIDEINNTEYTVLFKENKNYPNYGYSKTSLEFEDGSHLFWIRDTDLINKILPLNKNSICRVFLFFDWYINKNLDPVFMFKIKDINN